jgi:beta-phosphoglucomutase-like phosphatase (HAD superfamily)
MVDSEPLWFSVEGDFVRERGGEWTAEIAHACIGQGMAKTLATMAEVAGLTIDRVRDEAAIVERFLLRAGELAVKPGCFEILDWAHGVVPLAAASSSSRRLVVGVLERLGLARYFGAIVTGDDVAHPKPAPDIFLEAARLLGVEPSGCVVLEDSLAGATAGHRAGMQVIAIPERPTPGLDLVATLVATDLHRARAGLTLI